ncbi:MAG: U32 family peptidase [Fibrobacter sp.]|nr:U32 family peptidase [Fibrobacter sp.]
MREHTKRTIELLAPGGDADCVKAAISAGADAVYCGLGSFNARQRASNLSLEELQDLVAIAAQHGSKLYLTLNTLVFDHEIPEILTMLEGVYKAGVRVIIVQDLGLLHLIKSNFPEIEVHASTQLTTHNEGQIAFLSRFGVAQINLSRELSVKEIQPLCDAAHDVRMRVEVFVHGAFCISFSGQCYMSSNLCGKSGNRGACVQPCRRLYSLPHAKDRASAKAIFNLKDNFVFAEADKLYNAGVDSFKIEGRIKKFPYVYNVTSAWRDQIDALKDGREIRNDDNRLSAVFNRKFTSGYIDGAIGADMFIDSSRDQSLKHIANVAGYWADKKVLTLDTDANLEPDTEVLIYSPDFTFICKGVCTKKLRPFEYQFVIEHKLKGLICDGYQVFTQEISDDADRIKAIIDAMHPVKIPLTIQVSGTVGEPLKAVFKSPDDAVTLLSQLPLSEASNRPLDKDGVLAQFSRLGTTQFTIESLDVTELGINCFIPQKELNRLRCAAVDKLSGNTIDASQFAIPLISQDMSQKPNVRKAFVVDTLTGSGLQGDGKCNIVALILPNSIENVDFLAASINGSRSVIPFFSSILIGLDFTNAVALLEKLDRRMIITDNTGIADVASRTGRKWIAGPGFNIINSYAVKALATVSGFCGVFLSSEFSKDEVGQVQVPSGVDLWQALNYKKPIMTTRQCLIRNISGCVKKQCDKQCLPKCNRSATVTNTQGKQFTIVKKPGFYTVVLS